MVDKTTKNKDVKHSHTLDEMIGDSRRANLFIEKNKVPLISIVLVIIVSVIGWGVYAHNQGEIITEKKNIISEFEGSDLKQLQEKKISVDDYLLKLDILKEKIGDYEGLVSVLLRTSDLLVTEDKLDKAISLLEFAKSEFATVNPYISYFILTRLGALYEDAGKDDKAIELFEILSNANIKLMEGKIHLDLGRLYLMKGDKEKARYNLHKVTDNVARTEFIKIAKLYLEKLNEK